MSMSTVPPPAQKARPWYLIVALICCMLLGGAGTMGGCATVTYYRVPPDFSASGENVQDPAERSAILAEFERFSTRLDGAKNRVFPLGVGSLVLGMAMLAFAMRALAGQKNARGVLVQVVAVQALLVVLAFFLTSDVRRAQAEAQANLERIQQKFHPNARAENVDERKAVRRVLFAQAQLTVYFMMGSGLILVALTRPKSREFFEKISAPRNEV